MPPSILQVVYEVLAEAQASSLGRRVNEYQTKICLKGATEAINNGLLVEASATFYQAIEELYEKYIKAIAKPLDSARMLLKTDALDSYISTPVRSVFDLTPNHLLTAVEKSQNSGASIKFSDNLIIEFLHIRRDPGWRLAGGAPPTRRRDLMYFGNHHQKRSCRTVTTVGKNTCVPACCVVGAAHERMISARKLKDKEKIAEATQRYKELVANPGKNKKLREEVDKLYDKLPGVKRGTALNLTHMPLIEKELDIRIKVVSIPDQLKIVYESDKHPTKAYVYLLYSNPENLAVGHYDLITNVKGFFSKPYYCTACDKAYWHAYNHRCKDTQEWWCFACYERDCKKSENPQECPKCKAPLHSQACAENHEKLRCDKRWKCDICRKQKFRGKVYDVESKEFRLQSDEEMQITHDCDMYTCKECKTEVDVGHRCFVKPKKYKEKIQKLMFFDVETDQSTTTHIVNYIHMIFYDQTPEERQQEKEMNKKRGLKFFLERQLKQLEDISPKEADDFEDRICDEDNLEQMQDQLEKIEEELALYDKFLADHTNWNGKWVGKSYEGQESLTSFCKDLHDKFEGYTCIAHNLKGFDGVFILKTFLENGIIPEVICKGQKLLEIRVSHVDLRFIDSFNFLPMSLAKLPEAFALGCGSKGHFPHFFNRPENQSYVGPYPEPKYYGVSQMSCSERKKFYIWYKEQEGKTFDFKEQMARYCAQDVEILKESCLAYRQLMCKETGCDPFAYITLASVCSAVYMTRFMPEETIARVPASGYERHKYSSESTEWLEYLRRHKGVRGLQHATNGGEVKIGKYYVDGFDKASNTVYEYYGCFFHGCKNCFSGELRNPDTNKRLIQSYTETMLREKWLRSQNYKVVTMWGCDWLKVKQKNSSVKALVDSMKLTSPLNPRDAFYGGRTETFKIWSNDGPIVYHDVTSLYPWVNSKMLYPVGHPEIILSDFKDISQYFGVVKCTMLPPRNLYLPVLPVHAAGKLLFPLCRSCAENTQQEACCHNDDERAIHGTWFSEEVKLALEKGYRLIQMHAVWHFDKTTKHLFAPYMRMFFEKKMTSSKLQCNKDDEEAVLAFMAEVKEKEGIIIKSPDDFKENPGLRQITKLMLNNLWGRFGMNENMSTSQFVSDFEELEKILEDVTREVQAVRVINEKIVQVTTRVMERDYLSCSRDTNIFVALATTAWARIRLYRELDKLGDRVLYCDTDSVIYRESPNPDENLKLGKFLGDMTSELDEGDYIKEFVSGGPKNYGYVTKNGKTEVKIKGFTLNSTNAVAFSFEKIKEVIINGVANVDHHDGRAKRRKCLDRAEFLDKHLEHGEGPSAFAGSAGISAYNPVRIFRTRTWDVIQKAEQKLYSFNFDKRVIDKDSFDTFPYGYLRL
jgi:hypothetical protein